MRFDPLYPSSYVQFTMKCWQVFLQHCCLHLEHATPRWFGLHLFSCWWKYIRWLACHGHPSPAAAHSSAFLRIKWHGSGCIQGTALENSFDVAPCNTPWINPRFAIWPNAKHASSWMAMILQIVGWNNKNKPLEKISQNYFAELIKVKPWLVEKLV